MNLPSKPVLARGLLGLGVILAVVWLAAMLPLAQVPRLSSGGPEPGSASDGWRLAALPVPPDYGGMATEIARHQRWSSATRVAESPSAGKAASSKILGIARIGELAHLIVLVDEKPQAFAEGDTLPDGRRILSIGMQQAALQDGADDSQPQIVYLFPVDRAKFLTPPSTQKDDTRTK